MDPALYRSIKFENIDTIRNKMVDIVLKHTKLNEPLFQYVKATEFTDIPELKEQLQTYGLYQYLHYAVINVSLKGTYPIHKDTGGFVYSLNIPILGFDNTFLNFYSSTKEPRIQGTGQGNVTYMLYNHSDCEFVGKVETNEPAIVNTQVPHAFQNCNILPRVVILFRINQRWDINEWLRVWGSNPPNH